MNEITQAAVRVLIRDLLAMPMGSVRPGNQSQPTEGQTIACMVISELDSVGWSAVSQQDTTQTHQQIVNVTATLDFLGDEAQTLANRLSVVMQRPDAQERLNALNIGYLGADSVRDLSALELDRLSRYQVKMQFSTLVSTIADVAHLETLTMGIFADT